MHTVHSIRSSEVCVIDEYVLLTVILPQTEFIKFRLLGVSLDSHFWCSIPDSVDYGERNSRRNQK